VFGMQKTTDENVQRLCVWQQRAAHMLDCGIDLIESMVAQGRLERIRLAQRKYGITMRSLNKLIGEAEAR